MGTFHPVTGHLQWRAERIFWRRKLNIDSWLVSSTVLLVSLETMQRE